MDDGVWLGEALDGLVGLGGEGGRLDGVVLAHYGAPGLGPVIPCSSYSVVNCRNVNTPVVDKSGRETESRFGNTCLLSGAARSGVSRLMDCE